MTAQPDPGRSSAFKGVRPGGRSARVRDAVLAAATAELMTVGYAGLTYARVAGAAGVAESTVRRRWPSRASLASEVVTRLTDIAVPVPDTGSVEGDLLELTRSVAAQLSAPGLAMVLRGMAALPPDELKVVQERHWETRRPVAEAIARRAAARGELPEDADGWELMEKATSPIWMRLFVTGLPVDDAFLRRSVARTLYGFAPAPRP